MPGKNFIKVSSIIFIISAILAILVYSLGGLLFTYATVSTGEGAGWIFVVVCLIYTVAAVLQLIAGVKGIKGCDKKEAAADLKKWGIIVLVIAVIAGIFNFINAGLNGQSLLSGVVSIVLGFVFPGLYFYGASKNEKA